MNKHTFYSYLILGMTFAFVFSAQAQNKVSAPMKDVNQVIDNTLDSLNKARTARPVAVQAGKEIIPFCFWWVTYHAYRNLGKWEQRSMGLGILCR